MTDKTTLCQMSKDVLVIPFTEETAEKIDKFCSGQIENLDADRMEELIMSFLTRKNDEQLEKAFKTYVSEEFMAEGLSIAAIMPVIAEYTVLKAIEECEDEGEKALFSLMLKNALILAVKGNWFVANAQAVANTFGYYKAYLIEHKTFEAEESDDVASELLETDEDTFDNKWAEVDNGTAKAILYDATLKRYADFVDTLQVDKGNSIKGAYNLVRQMVEEIPWLYADIEPAQTINKKMGEEGNETVRLQEVKDELKGEVEEKDNAYRLTSVLLRLATDDVEGMMPDYTAEMTVTELAVYLYYELLAEAICESKN